MGKGSVTETPFLGTAEKAVNAQTVEEEAKGTDRVLSIGEGMCKRQTFACC